MITNPQTKRWRILRRCLLGAAVLLTLIATFYTEESWRGKRAWENCKRELEAKGINMDWTNYIPAPVPDDQNVFAVPEMQKWFVGRGNTEFSKKLSPKYWPDSTVRLIVANLRIGLPGATPPSGSIVLPGSDPKSAKAEAARTIKQALGPVGKDPNDPIQSDFFYMANKPEAVQPAQLFLQCEKAPTEKDLSQYLPNEVKLEPFGENSYRVSISRPVSAADTVAWGETLEPDLAIIRQALQRPCARMAGDYNVPFEIPIPNFVTVRTVSQRLAALAECYMVLGQPAKALEQLTFMHQLCRVLEARPTGRPMTLVAAMINVAVTGLYVSFIEDGLRMQAWREPQLVALQEQLKEINLLADVRRAFEEEPVAMCHTLETITPARMAQWFGNPGGSSKSNGWRDRMNWLLCASIPRGWIYQNMAADAYLAQTILDSFDPANQMVFPKKVDALQKAGQAAGDYHSPYTFLMRMAIPNYSRAMLTTANNQTLVHEALIACALERYRLAHDAYPETLDALVPRFLAQIPPDLIGGQPLHYHRTDGGTFLLYSVGWNETDDGGKPGSNDDWVWDDTAR